jgi:serine/threonine-protein kinase
VSLGALGKYDLLEKIAEGGMGELFRAREVGPAGFERIVALKRIRGTMIQDDRSRQMFIEEARIASYVSHPNLVTLFQFGAEGDRLYLAMELIEGRDLAKILARCRQLREPLPIRLAVRIAEQVALGLDYLHRLGRNGQPLQLVHRDVSPQNILVSFDGAVKLTDFGIAYMQRSEPMTQAGILKGKMGYLTPEQLSETTVDGRADIFCLGIVLWEMLTGARLFQGTSDASIIQQVLHKRIALPSTLNVDVPAALDRVVMRALERDRSRRFERAIDMAHALEVLHGWVSSDAQLGDAVRRLFPEMAAPQQGLVSSPPIESGESRTETVSTANDRATRFEILVTSETAAGPLSARDGEPRPPPPPPVTGQAALAAREPPAASVEMAPRRLRVVGAVAVGLVIVIGVSWAAATWQSHGPPGRKPIAPVSMTEPAAPVAARSDELQTAVTTGIDEASAQAPMPVRTSPAEKAPSDSIATPSSLMPRQGHLGQTLVRASNVSPWAEVLVDGSSLGYTANTWKVAPGHRHLVLRNGKAGIEREFTLDFPAGGTVQIQGPLRSLQPEVVR